jgi:hypothetical protein
MSSGTFLNMCQIGGRGRVSVQLAGGGTIVLRLVRSLPVGSYEVGEDRRVARPVGSCRVMGMLSCGGRAPASRLRIAG